MREPATAYVGIGANLGDAEGAVVRAIADMGAMKDTRATSRSSLYRTAPVEATGEDFVNAVAQLSTSLPPQELLQNLQAIENIAGRERPFHNAPRTLDLDLLLYEGLHLNTVTLTLPHPRITARAFVLVPLHEIAPQLVTRDQLDAVSGQRITRL